MDLATGPARVRRCRARRRHQGFADRRALSSLAPQDVHSIRGGRDTSSGAQVVAAPHRRSSTNRGFGGEHECTSWSWRSQGSGVNGDSRAAAVASHPVERVARACSTKSHARGRATSSPGATRRSRSSCWWTPGVPIVRAAGPAVRAGASDQPAPGNRPWRDHPTVHIGSRCWREAGLDRSRILGPWIRSYRALWPCPGQGWGCCSG